MHATLTSDTTIGKIAADHPLATRVFARHHIDYCCGGGRPLGEICLARGLDPGRVLEEISAEIAPESPPAERWVDAPLADLIDHLLTAYHQPLQEELPRLETMARKVARVHGDKDPERLRALLSVYLELKTGLEDHMLKEEMILFPMILRGEVSSADGPVAVMLREHNEAGEALARLRELTDGYTVPDGACNTWRALWHGLEALETTMHEHVHLENNLLFPRATAQRAP